MLYSFTHHDQFSALPSIVGLTFKQCEDPLFISILGQISLEEAQHRLLNDNRVYIAYWNNIPAAFGWMATGKARIGELNHEFIVPDNHGYLWNFRTLSEFRGHGIYPLLLQFILLSERARTECFWVMHAPENEASRRGIMKAGFRFVADVSLTASEKVVFSPASAGYLDDVLTTFGFTPFPDGIASCWNCSSPYIKGKSTECCCTVKETHCTGAVLQVA